MHAEPDPALIAGLRADLDEARYSVEGLEAAWGPVAAEALGRDDAVPALLELERGPATRAGTLGALFVLGAARSVAEVDAALVRIGAAGAERLGMLRIEDGAVRALVDLRPYALADESGVAAWWIASDPGELALGGELLEEEGKLGREGRSQEAVRFVEHLLNSRTCAVSDVVPAVDVQRHRRPDNGEWQVRSLGERTKNFARPSDHSFWFDLIRSQSLPGVAIMTCGRLRSSIAWVCMSIPPTITVECRFTAAPSTRNCSEIWNASSL